MKLSLFGRNKNVLLVGEGNFSFAITLLKHNLDMCLTASCFENNLSETVMKNVDTLKSYDIRVLLGVDATKLNQHVVLSKEKFDIVVFNFPHVGGKMRIEKNRELLRSFFVSVKHVLHSNGSIFVSLCDGQGGTPADKKIRHWNDSWQITEMAAHGDFILVAVEPFDSSLLESYTVTGYRSLEKQFNTQASLTHIFKLTDKPTINNIGPVQKIHLREYDQLIDWEHMILETTNSNENNSSLYPNCYKFDITFPLTKEFNNTKFYEILYNYAGLIINNVEYLGSYKFSDAKQTITYRITYKSKKFALHRKLAIDLHENSITKIIQNYLNIPTLR